MHLKSGLCISKVSFRFILHSGMDFRLHWISCISKKNQKDCVPECVSLAYPESFRYVTNREEKEVIYVG